MSRKLTVYSQKKNHPDSFTDEGRKKIQEQVMARINEAYRIILSHYSGQPAAKSEPGPLKKDNDTAIYKKGVDLFHSARHDGFFGYNYKYCYFKYLDDPLAKIDLNTLIERENKLLKSQSLFRILLHDYPESDWAYDSSGRLKEIELILDKMKKRIESLRKETDLQDLHLKEKDTYIYKKGVENFDKSRLYDYHYGFFSYLSNPFVGIDLKTFMEKEKYLNTAKTCFEIILRDFPESDWTLDAENKLKEIGYMLGEIAGLVMKKKEAV